MQDWIYLFKKESGIKIGRGVVEVNNIRDHTHIKKPVVKYFNAQFKLKDLRAVWLGVEPLPVRAFSHIFLTFDFGDCNFVLSIEARRKKLQLRPVIWGFLPLFPVIYVCTTERDTFTLRSGFRGKNVYLYKLRLSRLECRKLLGAASRRMKEVQDKQLRFNSMHRNCTSEALHCIKESVPYKFNSSFRKYWSTRIDFYLFCKGLLDTTAGIKELRLVHNVSAKVRSYDDSKGDFSKWIRKNLLP
jgi:hypothetical protein